jgi:hypothetical protein
MSGKPPLDTRLWYGIAIEWSEQDPMGKMARGIAHRYLKGQWCWHPSLRFLNQIIFLIKEPHDAMLLRLHLPDHMFWKPENFQEGYEDYTTDPPSIFTNGQFRDMTAEELLESDRRNQQELLAEIDETDDWVQYTYETHGSASPEYQAARIK